MLINGNYIFSNFTDLESQELVWPTVLGFWDDVVCVPLQWHTPIYFMSNHFCLHCILCYIISPPPFLIPLPILLLFSTYPLSLLHYVLKLKDFVCHHSFSLPPPQIHLQFGPEIATTTHCGCDEGRSWWLLLWQYYQA